MNDQPRFPGILGPIEPFRNPLDSILADIAISVQLPAGLHSKTGNRYEAIRNYVERPGSPLHGKVSCFYPQGSMAIDATISTRGTDDEYDLDVVVEIDVPQDMTPSEMLDLLEQAVADYPVKAIERQTRCITLRYADNMHVDLTPSQRLATAKDRESHISHAKHGGGRDQHKFVKMNAWAFGEWYKRQTPTEERFALAYNTRLYAADGLEFHADADVHLVPAQTPLIIKSTATVALQLIKRFRNVLYATTAGRIPPSVMLSCHAGKAAMPGMLLSDMVIRQARWTARAIEEASRYGRLVDVRNPEWDEDCFTDRWPENRAQQDAFAAALRDLADGLEAIRDGDIQLEDLQEWLRDRFGHRVVSNSLNTFNDRTGQSIRSLQHRYTSKGGVFVPAAPAIISSVAAVSPVRASSHTNMGERR